MIPAIKEYPTNPIVTVDDCYYNDSIENCRSFNNHNDYLQLIESIKLIKNDIDKIYDIAYVSSGDEEYLTKILTPSINSIIMNNPFLKIRFHIITPNDDFNIENKSLVQFVFKSKPTICDLKQIIEDFGNELIIYKVPTEDIIEKYKKDATYVKFYLPKIFKTERVLYLDDNTICLGDLSDKYCAVCHDLGIIAERRVDAEIPVGISFYNYFNAGVMLFDFYKINSVYTDITKKLIEFSNKSDFIFRVQDCSNVEFFNKVVFINNDYNSIDRYCDHSRIDSKCIILHFAGETGLILKDDYRISPHIKWLLHYRTLYLA